jgi:hypothetical protein
MARLGRLSAGLLLLSVAAACNDDPSGPAVDPDECTTDITSATDGTFVELCDVSSGPVRHVRIANFVAPAMHASASVVFGADAPPASPQDPLAADQFRVLLYGGGPPGVPPIAQATYGDVDAALDGDASFINSTSTVCFDLHDGSASTAPSFILWVDGQNGADCEDRSTLTGANAFGARSFWNGVTGAITKDANIYFRQATGTGATPTIALFAEPVLDEAEIAAAATCTTAWTSTADWQPLCDPAGIARHVRLESVSASAPNSYFYAILGEPANPTGNPAVGTAGNGKLIVTGGHSSGGASWTWFRFAGNNATTSTTQFNYATDTPEALYTEVAATICFDTGSNDEGNARFVFWATGANGADCADRTTLTLANALYDSTTDGAASGDMWDIPFNTGLLNFIKTNNATTVSMTNAVAFGEPAVLF